MKRSSYVVSAVLLVGGCESFDSVETRANDDAGVDAGVEAAALDVAAADADTRRFCERLVPPDGERVIYCRDFDDGTGADQAWTSFDTDPPDAASISLNADNVSPPSSFRARVESTDAGCAYARANIDLGPLPISSHVSFDVKLGGDGTVETDGASFFVIETGTCGLIIQANAAKGEVHAQLAGGAGDGFYDVLPVYPRASKWAHVEVALHRDTNQMEISVDGTRALGAPVTLIAGCLTNAGKLAVRPGMHCEPLSPNAREVRIDNVVATGTTP